MKYTKLRKSPATAGSTPSRGLSILLADRFLDRGHSARDSRHSRLGLGDNRVALLRFTSNFLGDARAVLERDHEHGHDSDHGDNSNYGKRTHYGSFGSVLSKGKGASLSLASGEAASTAPLGTLAGEGLGEANDGCTSSPSMVNGALSKMDVMRRDDAAAVTLLSFKNWRI